MNKKIEIIKNKDLVEFCIQTSKCEHVFFVIDEDTVSELIKALQQHLTDPRIVDLFILDDDGVCLI